MSAQQFNPKFRPKCKPKYKPSLLQDAVRLLFALVLIPLIPLALIILNKRGHHNDNPNLRTRFERFGWCRRPVNKGGIHFHCASVGEVNTAVAVIKAILHTNPTTPITVTTFTPTGSARARELLGNSAHICYLPFDVPIFVTSFINRVKPALLCIVEVELWPNLIDGYWRRGIPVCAINARMTEKSLARVQKRGLLLQPAINKLSVIAAQGKRDFDNFSQVVEDKSCLTLTNNVKFDQVTAVSILHLDPIFEWLIQGSNALRKQASSPSKRFVLVAGSTHAPEEDVILDALTLLANAQDTRLQTPEKVLLILVPRHPQRFDEVAQLLSKRGVSYLRSSAFSAQSARAVDELSFAHIDVVLVDEMGKLNMAYSIADAAFVGGSIADRGGHNALEPAAFGVPIMMGPNTYNNPEICEQLITQQGLFIVEDSQAIANQLHTWLADNAQRRTHGDNAKQVVENNKGAIANTIQAIKALLPSP